MGNGLKLDVQNITVILFDLDGTLYENTDQYEYYVKCLASRLEGEARERFLEDYRRIVRGQHTLKYGHTYDLEKRLVLCTDGSRVTHAWTWEGHPVDISGVYDDLPVVHDMCRFLTASDPWWVPPVCACHNGLSFEVCEDAFQQARKYMMSPGYKYICPPGIAEALRDTSLRFYQVLATNSPSHEGKRILAETGLEGVFDIEIYSAGKPHGTAQVVKHIVEYFGCAPCEILSIGDNPFNEIFPPRNLGCQTLLVDPCGCYKNDESVGPRVDSLSQVFPLLLNKPPFRSRAPGTARSCAGGIDAPAKNL